MKILIFIGSIAMLPLVAACSAFGLINAASSSSYYERYPDIAYGDRERQTLDVYEPSAAAAGAPVVVFFYGGGWRRGSKDDYEFVASSLTRAGYLVVVPDYRLYPQVRFPAFVEDAAAAVAWVDANAERFGGDSGTLFLMGHSAGAHIAALLALDARYVRRVGVMASGIDGLIGLSGPYDFLPLEEGYLQEVFPDPGRAQSQPINHVTPAAPPTLLIHGSDDTVVSPDNSRRLAAALDAAGVTVELKIYDGVGHARVAAALAPPLDFIAGTVTDAVAFIEERTRSAQD